MFQYIELDTQNPNPIFEITICFTQTQKCQNTFDILYCFFKKTKKFKKYIFCIIYKLHNSYLEIFGFFCKICNFVYFGFVSNTASRYLGVGQHVFFVRTFRTCCPNTCNMLSEHPKHLIRTHGAKVHAQRATTCLGSRQYHFRGVPTTWSGCSNNMFSVFVS